MEFPPARQRTRASQPRFQEDWHGPTAFSRRHEIAIAAALRPIAVIGKPAAANSPAWPNGICAAGNPRRQPRLPPDARCFSIDSVQLRNILNIGMG